MYFPILRAKQFELEALAEAAPAILRSGKIVPILEPVNQNTVALIKAMQTLRGQKMPLIVVLNPARGELAGDVTTVSHALSASGFDTDRGVTRAVHLHDRVDLMAVDPLIKNPTNHPLVVIHRQSRRRAPVPLKLGPSQVAYRVFDSAITQPVRVTLGAGTAVELHHCFQRRTNSTYSPDEFFSSPPQILGRAGIEGISDFTVVGDVDPNGGGIAHAVAIHLTYERAPGIIHVRHFVSDRTQGPRDPGGKFLEAVAKLATFVQQNPMPYSTAVPDFLALHGPVPHYPGLGIIKKLSIRHHLELMAHVL